MNNPELLAHLSYAQAVNKNEIRAQLEKDLAEFTGEVKVLKGFEGVARNIPKPKKSNKASIATLQKIKKWLDSASYHYARKSRTAEAAKIPLSRISDFLNNRKNIVLTKREVEEILAVMPLVEKAEQEKWGF